jgi:mannose-6-phosphate isomerase-like protein (cupin superfamily)
MPNRRDIFKLAALPAALPFFPMMMAAAASKIPNSTMDKTQAKVTHDTFGDLRIYMEGSTDQLGAMTFGSLMLKPGMAPHPPHEHPEEEIMILTEGSGEISVEGKITKVAAGSSMYCAAGKLHGIVNTGKVPLLFYFFKWKV